METANEQATKTTLDKMPPSERNAYDVALSRLNTIMADHGLSRYDVSQRSGIPAPTLNPWMEGITKGSYPNTTRKVEAWIQTLDDAEKAKPAEPKGIKRPAFVETQVSREIFTSLTFAQSSGVMVSGTYGTGMGKTSAAEEFAATRSNVIYIVASPLTSSAAALQAELVDATGFVPVPGVPRMKALGRYLSDGGKKSLIIIDEAQHLKSRAIDSVRYLRDVHKVGLAFLGNGILARKLDLSASPDEAGQVQSRFRRRKVILRPIAADVAAYIDAWGISDPKIRELLTVIGMKTGSLRQISETLESALTAAQVLNCDLTPELIRDAWHDRTAEKLK
jgi:Uncharacterized ATPase, putative transposase